MRETRSVAHTTENFEVEDEYHADSGKHFAIKLRAFISVLRTFSYSFIPTFLIYLKKP